MFKQTLRLFEDEVKKPWIYIWQLTSVSFKQNISPKKPHVVKRSDVSAFAATHYHMPESAVDREADTEQVRPL